ncbi:MAG: class I SAM-dependent methyltransferase, partial [Magnetococcales bacterium]|nr:class I SAM-dependent methyltransferase [Magnetococcales bacterium]
TLPADAPLLLLTPSGLELRHSPPGEKWNPIRVDFASGAWNRRLGQGGERLTRAVGVKGNHRPRVVDGSAGQGGDAFLLAAAGCPVRLIERSPAAAALLWDGLQRAARDPRLAPIVQRMTLQFGDAHRLLRPPPRENEDEDEDEERPPEVIYLDPMFPDAARGAPPRKEMRLLRALAGDDDDAPQLLRLALSLARERVVVKRPRRAPPLPGPAPSHAMVGSSVRFDVYVIRSRETRAAREDFSGTD